VEIFKKYKAVWLFILKFFGVYIIGVLIYNYYLSGFSTSLDQFSIYVTEQVASLFSTTLPEITTSYSCTHPIAEIQYYQVPLVLITEGCNAISVMILFMAFLVAFKGAFKHYLWFVPLGLMLLYVSNIVRIYLIGMIVLYYPKYVNFSHDFLFPGIIYGTTFLLWVVWVKYFANKPESK
tara:strand:+ start:22810 stop:23346 length:537 start_codon:yes stop_codon:yes gene_type:complete